MPYKHCQYIMEDGHRCNKTFGVRTNLTNRTLCPEHEPKKNKAGSSPAKISGKNEQVRKFVDDLYTFRYEDLTKKITKLFDYHRSTNDTLIRIMKRQDDLEENFSKMKNLNSQITESLVDKNPDTLYHNKLQKQLVTLNNELIRIRREIDEMQ